MYLNYDEEYYTKNEIVYKENDSVNELYLILEGEFQLYKKGKQISVNKLKIQTKLMEKIIFGDGQRVILNKKKIIEQALSKSLDNSNKFGFYLNQLPYPLIKLKVGDIFGDLEISQKYEKRKLSVKATGLKNIVWFIPKKIVEEILTKIYNNNFFQSISTSKYDILKKQYNKVGLIDCARKKYNINNGSFFKREIEDDNKTNNSSSAIKKQIIIKNLLNKTKTLSILNDNNTTTNMNNFCFLTQRLRYTDNITPKERLGKIGSSSLNVRKKIINYLEQKVKKFNNGFLSHNYSDNNSFNSDSPYSLLTEKRLLKKKEFMLKNYGNYFGTHREKIKLSKIKFKSFSQRNINEINKEKTFL